MARHPTLDDFLSRYSEEVFRNAFEIRGLILKNLPGITEEMDEPARMIGYAYGKRYIDTVCVLIPSKKGLKLGFYKGADLPDPESLLKGTGKLSRYVEIRTRDDIRIKPLTVLLKEAYAAYRLRAGQ